MANILTRLKTIFQQFEHQPIVVAYSGGIDSKVLLHAIAQLKQQQLINNELSVCHINHGLSDNALLWQQAAVDYCQQLSLPIKVFQVNIKEIAGQSLEALARDARYAALKSYAANNALIVTGHHLDDQSETFLLALKRGAGLKGLSSMAEVSLLSSKNLSNEKLSNEKSKKQQLLLRPLLSITRAEIEQYAQLHGLTWLDDESNEDLRFDRNFIRHQIMPLLTKRWPSILTTIKRSSEHCQEGQQLLTELAEQDLTECQLTPHSLSVNKLCQHSQARFNNVIRYFLEINDCLMPSTKQLQQVHQQIQASRDKTPEISIADYCLRRYQDALWLTADYQDLSTWQHQLSLQELVDNKLRIALPDNLGLLSFELVPFEPVPLESSELEGKEEERQDNNDLLSQYLRPPSGSQQISVRFNHQNPRCLPDYRQHSRDLKKVLQELNIAPWQRKRVAFLYYDNTLVAAVGYFVCKEYLAQTGQLAINVLSDKAPQSNKG